jgi:hypothetical protein
MKIAIQKPDASTMELIRRSGDIDPYVSGPALRQLAKALTTPLRQGVLVGDVVRGLYEARVYGPVPIELPLDLLAPGEEDDFTAYVNPGHGKIPYRQVEGDYVQVPTFGIANSIDWLLRFARDCDYSVVARCMQILEAGFVKKINDGGWHTILAAVANRNVLIYDGDATAGQFTKRLSSLMNMAMRRNAGGNAASIKRHKLTDLWMSPEGFEDVRNWNFNQVDDITRREIFLSDLNADTMKLYGLNIHAIEEFGESQEYQLFFTSDLGAALQASDLELVVGLDQSATDTFLMPIRQEIQVFDDPTLHRYQKAGVYGWGEFGFAVLDGRSVIAGSF